MRYTRWQGGDLDPSALRPLLDAGYPRLLSAVLASRGIGTAEAAEAALERRQRLSYDPLLMRDMAAAVERIRAAVSRGEKIAVFGDYDVDGITATCLLVDYLRRQGADCVKYIPRREEDGYGLGREAIRTLCQGQGVELLVTVDCGITAVEESRYIKELGAELVVTDHHECKDCLPEAVAVVNPRRSDCPYPFKHLAGVGVALKLVLALGGPEREEELLERYCVLAAIGTVADVMRMEGENRTIVHRGLQAIWNTGLTGLQALLRETGLLEREITSTQIGFVLAPRINAAGRMGRAELAADLLLTTDEVSAAQMAQELCALNRERQEVERDIYAQAVEQLETLPMEERSALVLSSDTWHQGVVGIVASRLAEKYACPSFMIHLSGAQGKGSCRSYGGFNLFAALEHCQDLLEGFGGHELAAGFTIRRENIPAFRRAVNEYVRQHCGGAVPVSCLDIDVTITEPEQVDMAEVEALSRLEPYGSGNLRPVFALLGAKLELVQPVGQNRHLKLRLSQGTTCFEAIYFSVDLENFHLRPGDRVDAAFHLQINEFHGYRHVQLQILDLRESLLMSRREQSRLELCRRLASGEALTAQEARRLLPEREQFVALWQRLRQEAGAAGTVAGPRVPLLRRLSARTGGEEPFVRTAVCLEVFRERRLLSLAGGEEALVITLDLTRRADLDECPYMQRLRALAQGPSPNH